MGTEPTGRREHRVPAVRRLLLWFVVPDGANRAFETRQSGAAKLALRQKRDIPARIRSPRRARSTEWLERADHGAVDSRIQ